MMAKWYSGNHGGLKLPDICLTGEEKPQKNFTQETSRPGIKPGPAAWQAHMLPPAPQRRRMGTIELSFIHYLSLTSPLYVPLHNSCHQGLTEQWPVGRGNQLWITYILLWPHKDIEGLPEWESVQWQGHLRDNTNMKDNTHHSCTHSF